MRWQNGGGKMENILYNPITGRFTRKIGKSKVGSLDKDGYLCIKVSNKTYKAHRLAWYLHYGAWPKDQLDHINGVRDDNRIENLREVTSQQNNFNRKPNSNSTSNYKGVSWCKRDKVWVSQIVVSGKNTRLGNFRSEIEAATAYDNAARVAHGACQWG